MRASVRSSSQVGLVMVMLCGTAPRLAAQDQPSGDRHWFGSAHLGWQRLNVPQGTVIRASGLAAFLRAGYRVGTNADLIGELGWLQTGRNRGILFDDVCGSLGCPDFPYLGPTHLLGLGMSVRLLTPPEPVRGYLAAGPGLYWMAKRSPDASALALGCNAAVGAVAAVGSSASLVVELGIRRLLTEGENPRWSVPVTVGVELH